MTLIWAIAVECPVCGTRFWTRRVVSSSYRGHDSDFRPRCLGADPLPDLVHRCPECDFCAYTDLFVTLKEPPDDLKHDAGGDPIRRYELAARKAREHGASSEQIAEFYLHAAWCARRPSCRRVERRNLERAARWYSSAVSRGEIRPRDLARIVYLIGELHRRCGDFDSALEWLRRAESIRLTPEQKKWLPSLIRRQKRLARRRDASRQQSFLVRVFSDLWSDLREGGGS